MAAAVLGHKVHGLENVRASFPSTTDTKTAGITLIRSTAAYVSTPGPITEAKEMPWAHWLRCGSHTHSWTNQCQGHGWGLSQTWAWRWGPVKPETILRWEHQSWREENRRSASRRGHSWTQPPRLCWHCLSWKQSVKKRKEAILNQESRRKYSSFSHFINHRVKEWVFPFFPIEVKSLRE